MSSSIENPSSPLLTIKERTSSTSEDCTLKSIITILNLTNSQRSSRQAYLLQEFTKKIKFFGQLTQEHGEYVHKVACEKLTYEFVSAGNYVFYVHTFGNKFYIIIEGEVSVIVPILIGDETHMRTVVQLHSGMSFGELALIKDQPRAASIYCETDCHFAVLSKEDYMNVIGKLEARKLDVFIEFLHSIPTFRNWTKKKLELLTYHFTKVNYKRKQVVFAIDSQAKYVYIVTSGEFELSKPVVVKNSLEHNEVYMVKAALLTRGEVFCDEEVLRKKLNSYSCICYSTHGELLRISASDFRMKLQNDDYINDFKAKDNSKNTLRNSRIENFRQFLVSSKQKALTEEPRTGHMPSHHQKRIVIGRLPPHRYTTTLTPKNLEKIKRKALGRDTSYTKYMSLSVHQSVDDTKSDLKSLESNPFRPRSGNSMKCHRPGGYFRANLKKSWIGYRSDSIQ